MTSQAPSKLWLHTITLPRAIFIPAAVTPTALGWLLAPSRPAWGLVLACLAVAALSAGLHSFDTLAGWIAGTDRPGGSVEKRYTSGSQVLTRQWAEPSEVAGNAIAWTVLGIGLVLWEARLAHSMWPLFGLLMALVFGGLYGLFWKRWVPELCGLLGFGVGGLAVGYAAGGTLDAKVVWIAGIASSMPFAVSWAVDQGYDAASDIQRGYHNIGGLLYATRFPVWAYVAFGAGATFLFQLFAINVGALSPWTGLTFLTIPSWVLTMAWLARWDGLPDDESVHAREVGVAFGMTGIAAYGLLMVLGQILALWAG